MDFKATLEKTVEIARGAGGRLREHFSKPQQIDHKGDVDLVTEADTDTEKYIVDALKEAFPKYSIIGEEGGAYSPGGGASDYYWYVDPLDGTTNFAHRLPQFSVSIALAGIDRRPVLGVVYNPIMDEMFTAYQDGGAHLNNVAIKVSQVNELSNALIATGFPYDRRTSAENNLKEFEAMLKRAQGMRRLGSAALDLAFVACGRLDGYWEQKLHLWDCLAGIILVTEAGGQITDFRGGDSHVYEQRPQVLASNGHIHDAIRSALVTAR